MSNSNTAVQPTSPKVSDEYRLSAVAAPVDATFALRVRGDSMVNDHADYSFPDGCIITVDPTMEAMPGHYVIVRLKGASEAIFRALFLQDGDGALGLACLNTKYPSMPLPADAKIVGVVTQKQELIRDREGRVIAERERERRAALAQ
jgi:SOS-response transcriptional repressor LexA